MRRRLTLFAAALTAFAPLAHASAQLDPGRAAVGLRGDAVPAATLLTDDLGRVRRAWGLRISARGATPEARARAFLDRYATELAIAPGATLAHLRTVDAHGWDNVRFTRTAFGGPVHGSTVVVRLRGDLVDYVAVDLVDAPLASATPVDADSARAQALAAHPEANRVLATVPGGAQRGGRVVPVTLVDVAGDHLHQRWRVLVDADGVAASHPLALDALGRVFESDPVTNMDMTADVELPYLTSRENLTGRYFRVASCNAGPDGCDPAQTAAPNEDGDFLYDPEEPVFDDAFAEVHGYFHANIVAEHFRETHGFAWSCGAETLMRVFVNYSERENVFYDNAAYSPSSGGSCGFMLFGQGTTHDFAYDSDVVYHEFGHAVVDGTANLGFFVVDGQGVSYDPGAINEGYADYVAATVAGDPEMAEYFMGAGLAGEGSLRSLDNEYVCPDDLVGEVHFDGRIFAGATWDIREAMGPEKSDALMYGTIAAIEMTASLADSAETMLATADALVSDGTLAAADRDTVEAVLEARGLLGCERFSPLDGGVTRLGYSGQGGVTSRAGGGLAPVHYRIDIPADAERLNINVADLMGSARRGEYTLHYRIGAPVRFVGTRRPPYLRTGELRPGQVLTPDSDPPLPRCETMYIGITTDNLDSIQAALFEVNANLAVSGDASATCEEPDAGPAEIPDADVSGGPDAGADMGGGAGGSDCGCRVGGGSPIGGLWLALAALAVSLRRRRASA